jgi:acylphosphatase
MQAARVHAVVHGRVQGVSFRWHTEEEAERLGLTGWVRNRSDGSVELEAEGARDAVERLVAWCRQGPPAARVTGVEVAWRAPVGGEAGFRIKP